MTDIEAIVFSKAYLILQPIISSVNNPMIIELTRKPVSAESTLKVVLRMTTINRNNK